MEQLKTIGRELAMGSQGGFGQSKEFLELVKSIGEARSKAEEDRIVVHEIETLKRRLLEPDIPKRKMKEYLMRLVYVEMLGHDASFAYIHAVKMTHDDALVLKRTGYLAVTLFLNDDHDLIILIVNTIQKDLRSDNYLVVCAALNAVCRLINDETIPAVLPLVVDLLAHPKEAVRKKAVMALHRFHLKSPSSVSHLVSNFRKRLCDNDPGVMGAALCPLFDLVAADPASFKDLVVSFVNILKQVSERRLPKAYDYHSMPAPFIQIKLLKILGLLGSGDKQASEKMYTVVGDIFKKCDSASNIGNAVLYESICCVSSIYPNTKLLEGATEVISRFLKSDSHNLKYMGIDSLGRLIKTSPEIAEQHQLAVIDCLEDPDDTLKRKTFGLLYKMTKSSNVEVIVDRMIDYMININDNHYKTYIASRCVELAEQFAPSNNWFIQTMNKVFEHAGDLVNTKVAHNLMRLIAEGFGEDDETADSQLRSSAGQLSNVLDRAKQVEKITCGIGPQRHPQRVQSYMHILGEPKLPSVFLQVICWVLGEYGTADGKYTSSYIIGKLCDVAEAYSNDETVRAYAITAIMKTYAFEISAGRRKVDMLPECQSLVEELSASHSTDLQQRAYELLAIVGLDSRSLGSIMPSDASCEDIEVDKELSFLSNYVDQSIEKGAQPYIPETERDGALIISNFGHREQHEPLAHGLKFEAYELPKPPVPSIDPLSSSTDLVPVSEPSSYPMETRQREPIPSVLDAGASELKLRLDGVQKKWGRPSYSSSPSTSSQKSTNEASSQEASTTLATKYRDTYESKKTQNTEVPLEKQKLAASLFGGNSSKPERKVPSSNHRVSKSGGSFVPEKPLPQKMAAEAPVDRVTAQQAPPDLLDFSEGPVSSASSSSSPAVDPFQQLEGLLGSEASEVNHGANGSSSAPDLMALYGDFNVNSEYQGDSVGDHGVAAVLPAGKGPSVKNSLEKDALVRQMGVNPSSQNPNLFSDLLR